MRKTCLLLLLLICTFPARATIFGQVHGVVHDPQHRPISGAAIEIKAANSAFMRNAVSGPDGSFSLSLIPLGEYTLTASQPGFASSRQSLTLSSDTSPVLHFELRLGPVQQTIAVQDNALAANVDTVTPSVLISRKDIAETPGADRTNSMAMITGYVPGAYMAHDMLHIRGGHQVSWLIDGINIPNTNIAGNLGAQIDPKDIDYIEVERGSYSADLGDRTYGVFNVVPRTGFERDRQVEIVLSGGSDRQTNDQINFGDHTQNFAYYASLNGNRSDYGLAPPIEAILHDRANGYGGFASLLYNRTSVDQFRLVTQLRNDFFQIPYDPDPQSFENQQFDSSGLRDVQHENDAVVALSWLHTFTPDAVLQVSPFFHRNRAAYQSNPQDTPVATTSIRSSIYGGGQASLTATIARSTLQAGLYTFGQHDASLFAATFNDGSGTLPFAVPDATSGFVAEGFLSDSFKAASWLTFIAGLRQTHFRGLFTENATSPRVGVAVQAPRLHWVFRAFYGRFYQPPPLLTASGPLLDYARGNNTAFQPLRGERNEEHQFGVQIPFRGWLLDADTFKTRTNNFLDHANLGNSSIYYPVTVDGALVRAWELSLHAPRIRGLGQAHLAYSNQIAQQRGRITGGLICAPIISPQCDVDPGYRPVDHDQRNTLSVGLTTPLPRRVTASTNISYGSGLTNGNPDPATPYPNNYLPQHTTFDLSLVKSFRQSLVASLTAINVGIRRVLIDNSLTFGGFHYNDPRQLYAELRYRWKY